MKVTQGKLDVSSSNYTINLGANWIINGTFQAQAGTVIHDGGAGVNPDTITTGGTGSNYAFYNFRKSGDADLYLTSNIDIDNDFQVDLTTTGQVDMNNQEISVGGDWNWLTTASMINLNNLVIDETTIAGQFNHNADLTVNNLTVNRAGQTIDMWDLPTISSTLTLTAGFIDVKSDTLSVGSISGGSSSSYIKLPNDTVSAVELNSIALSTTYNFPIGRSVYSPFEITINSASLSSPTLVISLGEGKYPTLEAGVTEYVNRYWKLKQTGITGSIDYDVEYSYDATDIIGSDGYEAIKYSDDAGCDGWRGSGACAAGTCTWNGLDCFSIFTGADGQTLPVELIEFKANVADNKIDLVWATSAEINNDYFVVEKSSNLENWEEVGIVLGAGNSNIPNFYHLLDENPFFGTSYYRLIQVDFDGTRTIYGPILAELNQESQVDIHVYPNPTNYSSSINVTYSGFEPGTEVLMVLEDILGKIVYSKVEVSQDNGSNVHVIDLNKNIPSGIYKLIGLSGQTELSKTVIVR